MTLQELGIVLKEKRKKEQLSIDHVAKTLKIRPALITDIENGLFSTIPGKSAYIIGFLRSYTKELQLSESDINDIIEKYKECDIATNATIELKFPEKINDNSSAPRVIIITSITAAIITYLIWAYIIEAPIKTTIHQPIAPSLQAKSTSANSQKHINSTTHKASNSRLVLLAKESTWIKVKDTNNALLHEATLQAGETFFLPEKSDLKIIAENTEVIEIFLDNNQQTVLGTLKELSKDSHGTP